MATPFRELVAKLGFQADLTEANRFNSAINKTKRDLEGLNQIKLGGFRNAMSKVFKVGSLAVGAAIGAGIATGLKFSDVQSVLKQLQFDFKEQFSPLQTEVQNILKDDLLGKLTTALELYTVAANAADQGLSKDFLIKNLRSIASIAVLRNKSIAEFEGAISQFIGTGGNLGVLTQLGEFDQFKAELTKVAGIGPGQAGIIARTALIEQIFAKLSSEVRKKLQEGVNEGAYVQKRFLNSLDALTNEIGKKTLPALQGVTEQAIGILDRLKNDIVNKGIFEAIRDALSPFPSDFQQRLEQRGEQPVDKFLNLFGNEERMKWPEYISKFFKETYDKVKAVESSDLSPSPGYFSRVIQTTPVHGSAFGSLTSPEANKNPLGGGSLNRANAAIGAINITNNVTVQPGATANAAEIKRAMEEANKKAWGNVSDQAKRTTLLRGGK